MAILMNISFKMVLAAFVMAGILISGDHVALGQGCLGDLQGLITQCARYVQRVGPQLDPSQECCSAIKSVDIACVCKFITREIETVIDMAKVTHVAVSCGKPLDPWHEMWKLHSSMMRKYRAYVRKSMASRDRVLGLGKKPGPNIARDWDQTTAPEPNSRDAASLLLGLGATLV
ncbi:BIFUNCTIONAL INHIBITOR/LIPID-TRANSFER PROTEIN/SEED STORAGE 2S ALBUMIN SUPERFAMILY PROTEIN [Salix purpurea]|uniref:BIFUNCTIONAL INHIBITOR/LIPID-TRANSFER PROTEIN/SEED STORAGE 2S ALBUMIN SUPERFAMILY PROTEIN n=1 Tax=Salix purpurea TaxID=77065 RepID=A0A9Q0TKH9_SALPP|nr:BIFUNCTIONAL INHIBITOR/LIPID-TRANSFER PROTEIN/SEED STORAGE 2S ALBUMIN SUPERFAMILY PROTEIN [Salix purpurea]